MFNPSWANGIGALSILFAIPLVLFFKSRNFGFFDPLNFFLITRVAPMFAALALLMVNAPSTLNLILFFFSATFFISTLFLLTPKSRRVKSYCNKRSINYFVRFAIILILIKVGILLSATGSLPIFSKGGSDAYINFDVNNKLGSSFLLGLGTVDIILFSFVIPLVRKTRSRILIFPFLLLAMLLGMLSGKKSAVLLIFLSVAFGEYLRIALVANQKRYFLRNINIIAGVLLGVFWAAWIYTKTEDIGFVPPDIESISSVIDFVMFQWAYTYFMFTSDALNLFFQSYQVNQWTYFFHSILSPLGFPAFHASIGPAISEYLTGELTGHGVNPSFVVEGYVLLGVFSPLYAIFAALLIGKGRLLILRVDPLEYKVVISALLLPALYTFASDGLLFAKQFYVSIFVILTIAFPLRLLTHAKRQID